MGVGKCSRGKGTEWHTFYWQPTFQRRTFRLQVLPAVTLHASAMLMHAPCNLSPGDSDFAPSEEFWHGCWWWWWRRGLRRNGMERCVIKCNILWDCHMPFFGPWLTLKLQHPSSSTTGTQRQSFLIPDFPTIMRREQPSRQSLLGQTETRWIERDKDWRGDSSPNPRQSKTSCASGWVGEKTKDWIITKERQFPSSRMCVVPKIQSVEIVALLQLVALPCHLRWMNMMKMRLMFTGMETVGGDNAGNFLVRSQSKGRRRREWTTMLLLAHLVGSCGAECREWEWSRIASCVCQCHRVFPHYYYYWLANAAGWESGTGKN